VLNSNLIKNLLGSLKNTNITKSKEQKNEQKEQGTSNNQPKKKKRAISSLTATRRLTLTLSPTTQVSTTSQPIINRQLGTNTNTNINTNNTKPKSKLISRQPTSR